MKSLNSKAFSILEYAVLFIIVIGAFMIMRSFIQRGIYGAWANSGKTYGYGRQYDPQKTVECSFDQNSNVWYDRYCADSICKGVMACVPGAVSSCQTNSCKNM